MATMLIFPPTLYELIAPSMLSIKPNAPELAYLPNAIIIVLLVIWVADYIGLFLLTRVFWKNRP